MSVQTATFMALRYVRQTVCGFKLKIFKQRGCHYYGLIDSKTAEVYRKRSLLAIYTAMVYRCCGQCTVNTFFVWYRLDLSVGVMSGKCDSFK
ncbi:hypothetical protein D3C72_2184820 [compost metagenome]